MPFYTQLLKLLQGCLSSGGVVDGRKEQRVSTATPNLHLASSQAYRNHQLKKEHHHSKSKVEEGKISRVPKKMKSSLQAAMQTETKVLEEQQSQIQRVNASNNSSRESQVTEDREEEMTKSALITFRAKEEEIEKKKLEVREKVRLQLGRVEEETKRLATIREELDALTDPLRKDVAAVRKKIDAVNRDLKPLGQTVLKKEREYKEILDVFNEKNKEKSQLLNKLMEVNSLVGESERLRMKKLEELSKNIDSLH